MMIQAFPNYIPPEYYEGKQLYVPNMEVVADKLNEEPNVDPEQDRESGNETDNADNKRNSIDSHVCTSITFVCMLNYAYQDNYFRICLRVLLQWKDHKNI